jgi:hypothetical protein
MSPVLVISLASLMFSSLERVPALSAAEWSNIFPFLNGLCG